VTLSKSNDYSEFTEFFYLALLNFRMMRKKILIMALFMGILNIFSFSQIITRPNFALKSPETLKILKVEITTAKTIVSLSVENLRTEGGSFCADRNIYILYPDGKKSKLLSSSGIPVCPDTYRFKYIGEKLDFTLSFPPIESGTEWVDLIEECNENCFFFYGISLDPDLNRQIDEAFTLAEGNEPEKALDSFISLVEKTDSKNLGTEGLLYINIITLAKETGNVMREKEWYKRFLSSGAPRLSHYIKFLNDKGIKF
jgi:hypothetical protein